MKLLHAANVLSPVETSEMFQMANEALSKPNKVAHNHPISRNREALSYDCRVRSRDLDAIHDSIRERLTLRDAAEMLAAWCKRIHPGAPVSQLKIKQAFFRDCPWAKHFVTAQPAGELCATNEDILRWEPGDNGGLIGLG